MLPNRALALFADAGRIGMALMDGETVAGRSRGSAVAREDDGVLVLEAVFGPYAAPVQYDGIGLYLDDALAEIAPLGDTMRVIAGTVVTQQVQYETVGHG